MSGHSKWHNIKLKKTKVDSMKGKVFTKLAREIIIAARQGGADPDGNFRLKLAVQKAKEANMPKENIERAISKAAGSGEDGNAIEEMTYEGYGPGGVALMLEIATDNKNRTVPELRNVLGKNGGSLGEPGCVAWMFDRKGILTFDAKAVKEDDLLACVLDAGAEDLRSEEDLLEVITDPSEFQRVKEATDKAGYPAVSAEIAMIPKTVINVSDRDAPSVLKLMEMLENHDDVQKIHSNFDIDSKILEELAKS